MSLYKSFADSARVWVYQSDKAFNESERNKLSYRLKNFADNWCAHGEKVIAEGHLFHGRFIVLFADVDRVQVSGCAIDESVHFVQEIEKELNCSLMNRKLVVFCDKSGELKQCLIDDLQQLFNEGIVSETTEVFNNLVTSKKEWADNWRIPLSKSWHNNYLKIKPSVGSS